MLREIVAFEWRYQTRQPAFIASALFFLIIGFTLAATGFGPANVAVNSPYLVMESLAFTSLFGIFAIAIFASTAVVRDAEHRTEQIVYSLPITKLQYLGGRFGGTLLAAISSVSFAAVGMIVATFTTVVPPDHAGAFRPAAYLAALAFVVVPNIIFAAALLFAIAIWTRNTLATSVGAVFLYILYFISAALTDSPLMAGARPGGGGGSLAALLDPFAMSSFFAETRHWTIAQKNAAYVPLAGSLLLNRLLWLAVAALLCFVVYQRFAFRVMRRTKLPKKRKIAAPTNAPVSVYRRIAPESRAARVWWNAFRSTAWFEVRTLLQSAPFIALLIGWFVMAISTIHGDIGPGEYGASSWAATSVVVDSLRQPLSILAFIILVYYAADVFWREHRYNVSPVLNATPVQSSVFALGKMAAMVAAIVSLTLVAIAAGLTMQIAGGTAIEWLPYASLFYFVGLPLVLFAAAATLVQAASPGRYAGMIIFLAFVLFANRAPLLGLEHPLWRYATAADVEFSEMNGFAQSGAFHWLMLHWTIAAVILLALATALWRSVGMPLRERRRALALRWPKQRVAFSAGALCMLLSGSWIFYNTDIVNTRLTRAGLAEWKADYEKRFAADEVLPQPIIDSVTSNVDLYPRERRLHVRGRYELVNATQKPISTIVAVVPRDARITTLAVPQSRVSKDDRRFNVRYFALTQPLAAGARTELTFDLTFDHHGFAAEGDDALVDNGSFVFSQTHLPALGYRRSNELADPRERAKYGLRAHDVDEQQSSLESAEPTHISQRVRLDLTIGTDGDQLAVAPGTLRRDWTTNGRRYFRFTTDAPVVNQFVIASARYARKVRRVGATSIEIYYTPRTPKNVDAMLDAAAAALTVFQKTYGPYPHPQLRLAEVPSYWKFGGLAMPGTIFFSENRSFLIDARDDAGRDLIIRRVAHEVAHQWWGYQVVPDAAPGASFLTESLTKDAELVLVKSLRGNERMARQLEYELDRYLSGRSHETSGEEPLVRVRADQPYLYYAKGAIVLRAIRDQLGDDKFNAFLRTFEARQAGRSTTTRDFVEQLRAITTPAQFAVIEPWLSRIVLYDLALQKAVMTNIGHDRSRVAVIVTARRFEADGSGDEREQPLNEVVSVGVFDMHSRPGERVALKVAPLRMHAGRNEVTLTVDGAPDLVVVDPYLTRTDRNRADNEARLHE